MSNENGCGQPARCPRGRSHTDRLDRISPPFANEVAFIAARFSRAELSTRLQQFATVSKHRLLTRAARVGAATVRSCEKITTRRRNRLRH